MRKLSYLVAMCILAVGAGSSTVVHAGQTPDDEIFANAALRSLHDLARAVAQYGQATKDSDQLGCRDAYMSMPKIAREALIDMHSMSFTPVDAIGDVSTLLRLSQLERSECPDPDDIAAPQLFIVAGQAIMDLRYDYSIGNGDWYTITLGGTIEVENPLHYAESLKNQSYSWINVRPKGMLVMVESHWKAEMASHEVDDPSIENSGSNLNAVEVDFRKNPDDSNTMVYFYRTKGGAQAAMQQAEADAKADTELKASKAEWNKKFTSLPYVIADHDAGFKLVYEVCRDTGKKAADGAGTCSYDGSHDWSDSPGEPYHWFSQMQSCEQVQRNVNNKNPDDVKIDGGIFVSACVPAPKINGHVVSGYEMVIAFVAPGVTDDNESFAEYRQHGSNTPAVFGTFKACNEAMDTVYREAPKDLQVDEDGNVLGDKTESIDLIAYCVRVY